MVLTGGKAPVRSIRRVDLGHPEHNGCPLVNRSSSVQMSRCTQKQALLKRLTRIRLGVFKDRKSEVKVGLKMSQGVLIWTELFLSSCPSVPTNFVKFLYRFLWSLFKPLIFGRNSLPDIIVFTTLQTKGRSRRLPAPTNQGPSALGL